MRMLWEDGTDVLLEDGTRVLWEDGDDVGTITGLTLTATGATWDAYTGADSYEISIGGGAFSSVGTETSYTGALTSGQTVVVRALDADGNVLAEATGVYAAGDNLPLVLMALDCL